MSEQKYDAFISYRHSPLDSKIATTIHKQLEHFIIPKEIKNQISKKEISRIFRDKEELPVTSDINDKIKQALDSSEYLIVICSHNLKESVWVKKEIEYFLKNHPIERVLTVLAEGEPDEVIPEILHYEKLEERDGLGNTKKVLCEPLSCDYRLSPKQAKSEELPRLVATILGCSYDDLKQRQKQRKIKITVSVTAACFAFLLGMTAFFAQAANRIRESYNTALINQSEYLVSESKKLYESGDKITATLLALEALPSEKSERPLLSEAVYNLESIIEPYLNSTSTGYEATAVLRHKNYIDDYSLSNDLSSDGKYMAVKNGDSTITVWDTDTKEIYFEKDFSEIVMSFCFSRDNTLIVDTFSSLTSIDYHNNKELWKSAEKVNLFSNQKAIACSKDNILAIDCGQNIRLINLTNGEKLTDIALPDYKSITYTTFSPNGKILAFVANKNTVYVYNLKTKQLSTLKDKYTRIENMVFGSDKEILIAEASENTIKSGRIENAYYTYEGFIDFISIDITKDTVQYKTRLDFSDIYKKTFIKQTSYFTDKGLTEVYVCAAGNSCMIIDLKSGKTIDSFHTTDSIVDVMDPDPSFESPQELYISLLLEEGSLSQHHLYDEKTINIHFFNENPVEIFSANGKIYVISADPDTDITVYEYCSYTSSDLKKLNGNAECNSNTKQIHETDNYIVLQESYPTLFTVINKKTNSVTYRNTIPENSEEDNKDVLGFSENGKELYILTYDGTEILSFNIENNKCTKIKAIDSLTYKHTMLENSLCYTKSFKEENKTKEALIYENLTTGQATAINTELSDKEDMLTFSRLNGTDSIIISYKFYETKVDPQKPDTPIIEKFFSCKMIDLNTGKITVCPEKFSAEEAVVYPVIQNDDGSLIAIKEKNYIHIFDGSFKKLGSVELKNDNISTVYLTDDTLYVGYSGDKSLYVYSVHSGTLLTEIDFGMVLFTDVIYKKAEGNRLLILNSGTLFILDTENNKIYSKIDQCCAFDYEGKKVYTVYNKYTDQPELGYYNILNYKELISKAKEKYPNAALSQQQKNKYGIE